MRLEGFVGDLPAKSGPLCVVLEPDISLVKARPRTYFPMKAAWLTARMNMVMGMGLVVLHIQGRLATPVMVDTKKHAGCLVSVYRFVNKQIQKTPQEMSDLEAEFKQSQGASALATLDLLQENWQCLLAKGAQKIFTIPMLEGLLTIACVPQGFLICTAHFESRMQRELDILNYRT